MQNYQKTLLNSIDVEENDKLLLQYTASDSDQKVSIYIQCDAEKA